jgi:stage II sporulation protein D
MRLLGTRIVPNFLSLPLCVALWAVQPSFASPVPPTAFEKRAPLQIRVRIAEQLDRFRVRGFDLRFSLAQSRFDRSTEWEVSCFRDQVRARQVGQRRELLHRGALEIDTPAGFMQFNGRPYREALVVVPTGGSRCDVVNRVDLEKYLDGLVNAEFSAGWSENAVAAQVIAARTYAIYQMREAKRQKGRSFDVDSTTRDQVYDGSIKEDWRASRSVEKTRGVILAVRAGTQTLPLKAFYHSTCGGRTELPERVWGKKFPGFRRKVDCPYCSVSPRFEWSADVTSRELMEAFQRGTGRQDWPRDWRALLIPGARLLGAQVVKTDSEGRTTELVTRWTSGFRQVELKVSAVQLRNWIGPTRVRSTRMRIGPLAMGLDGLRISGRGFGHGVGLCQWGAKVLGDQGKDYAGILKHYYPDAELKKLW